jgi:MFS transporter, DHA1 family, inner membrane transport protein
MPSSLALLRSGRQLTLSLLLGSLALLVLGVQPILLGALVDAGLVTLDDVGLLAMGEIIALGLGVVLGDLLPLRHFRLTTALAAVLAAGFDVATALASQDGGLLLWRALAGLAEGVLVWSSTCMIVRAAHPERVASIFMIAQTLAQAAAAALLARVVLPRSGWQGGFLALGVTACIAAGLGLSQPARLTALTHSEHGGTRWSARTMLPLLIVFLQLAAVGALWAYLEPLGQQIGLTAEGAQTVVSGVLFAQLAGGFVSAWLVRRLAAATGLVIASAALSAIAFGMFELPAGQTMPFILLAGLFGFFWIYAFPFQIGLAFRADPTGRVATLVPAVQLLGSAFGPLVTSLTVHATDARPAALVSAVVGLLGAVLLLSRLPDTGQLPEHAR